MAKPRDRARALGNDIAHMFRDPHPHGVRLGLAARGLQRLLKTPGVLMEAKEQAFLSDLAQRAKREGDALADKAIRMAFQD